MKSKRLLFAMEDIKDEFIEAAAPKEKKKSTVLWVKICAAAACVALIIAVGAGMLHEKPQALPILELDNIFDGGMSMEAHFAYSADELVNSNPWSKDNTPKELPVYQNAVYNAYDEKVSAADVKAMKKALLDAADKLGVASVSSDIKEQYYEPDRLYSLYIEKDNIKIEVNIYFRLNVEISGENVLPEGYTLDYYASYDEISKTAEYLKDKYAAFLDMEDPVANIALGAYDVYGRRSFSLGFYDGAGDISEQIKSYNFDEVSFWFDYTFGTLNISRSCSEDETVGIYPIITADEALELLEQGEYYTSVYVDFSGVQAVKKVELVYHISSLAKTFVPYYRFYIEFEHDGDIADKFPGMKSYGTYYVPAVEGKYISDHRAELFQ